MSKIDPVRELELKFFQAVREWRVCCVEARQIVAKFRRACKDRQRITLMEVALDWRETRRYGANMSRLYDQIIRLPVSDPEVYVGALTTCTKLYGYESTDATRRLMIDIDNHATKFFKTYQHSDLLRWLSAYSYNMAVLAVRNNDLDEAGDKLGLAIQCAEDVGTNWWWMPLVYAQCCLMYTKDERFDSARRALLLANQLGDEKDHPWRLYAAAYLAYEETHDLKDTAAYLQVAYEGAHKSEDYFLMSDILFLQACVHADSQNHAAFWYTHEISRNLERQQGIPLHRAFHTLTRTVPPLPRKEVITHAHVPSDGSPDSPDVH